jgi:hypothetical protein
MAQAIDLGRLRFFHQGAYAGGTTYELNDVVSYGAKSYVYISTTSAAGNLPTSATYWAQMADGQDYKGAWTTATAYKVDDIVLRGGTAYIALIAHTSGVFTTNLAAGNWEIFTTGANWRSNWVTSTTYYTNDVVFSDGNAYIATSEHVSAGAFSTDLAASKWDLFSQGGTGEIPSQSSNANKLLKTDGTEVSWTNAISIVSATLSGDVTTAGLTVNSNITGNNLNISNITTTSALNANSASTVGANSIGFAATLTNPTLTVQSDTTDYSQIAFRNLGTNANSSTDFIAYADAGDDDSGWIDMGITSTNFADASFTITGDHDGYIFMEAPANTAGNGNFVLATGGNGVQNKIIFAAGGLSSNDTQMVITPNTSVAIDISTNSTSATTGALTVAGGVGIGGNVFITGNTNITGTITVGGGAFSSNNLTVSDPIIFMGNTNTGDAFDLGFAGKFDDGAVKYAGLLRDASDTGKFRLFTGLTEIPSSTANFAAASNANLILGNLEASGLANVAGIVTISNATSASSTTAAALVVTGGIATADNVHVGGTLNVTGDVTITGNTIVSGRLTMAEISEVTASATIVSNLSTVLYTDTLIAYYAAPSANFTIDLTSVPTTNDRIITFTAIITQGATGYYPSAFQIDGVGQTIKWSGGAAVAATSGVGKIDIYTFNLLRTGSAWTVFGAGSVNY